MPVYDTVWTARPLVKLAQEVLPVGINFANLLADGETLTGSPTITCSPAGPTISNAAVLTGTFVASWGGANIATGQGLTFTLTGGTAGQRYELTVTCGTTTSGRIAGGRIKVLVE